MYWDYKQKPNSLKSDTIVEANVLNYPKSETILVKLLDTIDFEDKGKRIDQSDDISEVIDEE